MRLWIRCASCDSAPEMSHRPLLSRRRYANTTSNGICLRRPLDGVAMTAWNAWRTLGNYAGEYSQWFASTKLLCCNRVDVQTARAQLIAMELYSHIVYCCRQDYGRSFSITIKQFFSSSELICTGSEATVWTRLIVQAHTIDKERYDTNGTVINKR